MATDFEVNCIIKRGSHYDPHERIQALGNSTGKWMLSEDEMINRIEAGKERFHTLVNGRRASVVVAEHNRRKYLKTQADGYAPNNLLSLDDCSNCKQIG